MVNKRCPECGAEIVKGAVMDYGSYLRCSGCGKIPAGKFHAGFTLVISCDTFADVARCRKAGTLTMLAPEKPRKRAARQQSPKRGGVPA